MVYYKLMVLSVIAGIFIGIGGVFSLNTVGNIDNVTRAESPALNKIVTALTFPLALILILLCGGELFTGNVMIHIVGMYQGKSNIVELLKSWGISYAFNYIGCVIYAVLCVGTGIFATESVQAYTIKLAMDKLSEAWYQAFFRAIPCNMLVCLAIFLSIASEDILSKLISAWIPIACFVMSGYEHSIANVFYFHLAIFVGGDINYGQFLFYQLLPVTLGNIIGGGLFVALAYAFVYSPKMIKGSQEEKKEKKKYHLLQKR